MQIRELVSVVVPVYNVECYIGRCIESIQKQSYINWELILVDDGSTDNSGVICDQYARSDSRILVMHTPNKGRSSARNLGIKSSHGELLVFIDSDDFVNKDYLLCMLDANPNLDDDLLVSQGFHSVNEDGSLNNSYPAAIYYNFFFSAGEKQNVIAENRLLHRQAVWGRLFFQSKIKCNKILFPEKVHKCEDGVFLHNYMLTCNQYKFISSREYNYVVPKSSLSSKPRIDFVQEYLLSKIYSSLSVALIKHFKLERNPYRDAVSRMFHYHYMELMFNEDSPNELREKGKDLSREPLKYFKINNAYDLFLRFKYYLL